nr:hypothetical protein [Bacteroidota bacterium]
DNTSSYFQLSLVSNHIEKSCSLEVNQPRINTFTAFANEVISRDRLSRGTASWENYANVFLVVQNLMKTNIVECERVPDNYKHQHPVNALYVKHTEGKSSLTECEYYFGYIKDEIIVELTQNGGYDEATVKMITKESGSEDIKEFSSNSITFNLPGGNQESYNRNEFRKFSFEIIGKDAYSGFKDSFLAFLQDRCIIVYDSLFHEPNIVATDFLRLLFDNPNITISLIKDYNNRLWQKKYKQELRKPYLRNEKGFNRHFMKELKKELEVYKNKKQLENEIFNYYKDIEKYYKRKMASICKIGGSVKDIKEQITVLKRELFVKLAEKVLSKSIINNITQNVLTRK